MDKVLLVRSSDAAERKSRHFRFLPFRSVCLGITLSLLLGYVAHASQPQSANLGPALGTVTYAGVNNITGVNSWTTANLTGGAGLLNTRCDEDIDCDTFTLNFTAPTSVSAWKLTFRIDWPSSSNDFDLAVTYNFGGNFLGVCSSGQGSTTFEECSINDPPTGTYRIRTFMFTVVNSPYNGTITLSARTPDPNPPPGYLRSANYQRFDFGFTPDLKLPDQERSLIFINQDVEPEIEIDRFGTIYIGAIRGVPGGTDFWRSNNLGSTFTYLGEPDGTQKPLQEGVPGTGELGVGGGDDDIALGDPFYLVPPTPLSPGIQSTGRVYLTSLWLGSATLSVSIDRGEHWAPNPFTTAGLDRQWNTARGEKTIYMTLRKLVQLEEGQQAVYAVKSDDGATFTKSSFVQDPATGVHEDVAGNSVLTSNGTLYGSFVSLDGQHLYIFRCPKAGAPAPCDLPLGQTEVAVTAPNSFDVGKVLDSFDPSFTVNNTFPVMAVDKGDNLHLVFGNRHNTYLISCPAGTDCTQAANWTKPVPLNAPGVSGFEFTRTTMLPWVRGGDPGKVAVIWYGSDVAGDGDSLIFEVNQVPWKLIYAQVENALSVTPTVYLDIASHQGGRVIHKGQICVRGTGCPDGTRELAEYSSVTVDNFGFANIAYSGTIINGTDPADTDAITFFTKSTRRPALTPLSAMLTVTADDPKIIRQGAWRSVPDLRAFNGHRSYAESSPAIKNQGYNLKTPETFLEFSFTGTAIDMFIARGPRGGKAELYIDGQSRGVVDFYRPLTDPEEFDKSGQRDLSYGQFVRLETSPGQHTFRLKALNNNADPLRNMIYIEEFRVEGPATDTKLLESASQTSLVIEKTLVSPLRASESAVFSVQGQNVDSLRVEVFDLAGRRVFDSHLVAGNSLRWNLQTKQGRPVANGAYLWVVTVKGTSGEMIRSQMKKFVVLR
ncbi:PPC domain-containing protein [Candidatus Acetothermia bacterium]|nr:PPC domain-containing protein [Candidatus Acetothermia bacterium]